MCVPPLISSPKHMGKGHFPWSLMTSLVARRPKPNWVNKKEVIVLVLNSLGIWPLSTQFYQGSEGAASTFSWLCSPSMGGPSPGRLSLTVKERARLQAWNPLSSDPIGTSCNAQYSLCACSLFWVDHSHIANTLPWLGNSQRTSSCEDEEGSVLHRARDGQQSEEGCRDVCNKNSR